VAVVVVAALMVVVAVPPTSKDPIRMWSPTLYSRVAHPNVESHFVFKSRPDVLLGCVAGAKTQKENITLTAVKT
jgi:hypothetical protein